jgi:hypothetical protein
MTNLKRFNGPQIGSYLDKEIIEFKPIKKGEIRLLFIEMNYLGPYRKVICNLKIVN